MGFLYFIVSFSHVPPGLSSFYVRADFEYKLKVRAFYDFKRKIFNFRTNVDIMFVFRLNFYFWASFIGVSGRSFGGEKKKNNKRETLLQRLYMVFFSSIVMTVDRTVFGQDTSYFFIICILFCRW